ncbi:hypothetical protein B0O99DRAFT_519076, partial [Bisporella sp. PMI_857]
PPPLAPSIEEAYRRKCIQLKQRLNEVEEANDASRVRLVRAQRGIEKLRLERAFLLEQLAKRTSTNVDDSEGSPSPPPTPKEKPLRTKRGHRKPPYLENLGDGTSSTFIQQGPVTHSPSSDAFSHSQAEPNSLLNARALTTDVRRAPQTNGAHSQLNHVSSLSVPQKEPKNVFDVYCNSTRDGLVAKNEAAIAEGTFNVDSELAHGFQRLTDEERFPFEHQFNVFKSMRDNEKRNTAGTESTAFNAVNRSTEPEAETRPSATETGSAAIPLIKHENDVASSRNTDGDDDVEMGEDVDETGSHAGDGRYARF